MGPIKVVSTIFAIGSIATAAFYIQNYKQETQQTKVKEFVGEDVMASSTNNTASSSEDKLLETNTQKPYFKAVLKAPADSLGRFSRSADIFISTTGATAGIDSRTGQVESTSNDKVTQSIDGSLVEVEFGSFYEYSKRLEVAVVGLEKGTYELSVTMIGDDGVGRGFSFASSTDEQIVDTYSFDLEKSQNTARRANFNSNRPGWPMFEDDAGKCDASGLKTQLTALLTNAGWDMYAVSQVDIQVGLITDLDPQPLPFKKENVCAIAMNFKSESSTMEGVWDQPQLPSSFGYSSEPVIVGGTEFNQSLADGPLSSSNTIPMTQTGNEI